MKSTRTEIFWHNSALFSFQVDECTHECNYKTSQRFWIGWIVRVFDSGEREDILESISDREEIVERLKLNDWTKSEEEECPTRGSPRLVWINFGITKGHLKFKFGNKILIISVSGKVWNEESNQRIEFFARFLHNKQTPLNRIKSLDVSIENKRNNGRISRGINEIKEYVVENENKDNEEEIETETGDKGEEDKDVGEEFFCFSIAIFLFSFLHVGWSGGWLLWDSKFSWKISLMVVILEWIYWSMVDIILSIVIFLIDRRKKDFDSKKK